MCPEPGRGADLGGGLPCSEERVLQGARKGRVGVLLDSIDFYSNKLLTFYVCLALSFNNVNYVDYFLN